MFTSNSCLDMDADNTEEHKEQSICKQEQIDRKTFSYYSHNDQNIIMLLKYTKQGSFHGLIKTRTIFNHYKIFGEFAEDNRKSQSRSPRKIEDEHAKYILSQVDINGLLLAKIL